MPPENAPLSCENLESAIDPNPLTVAPETPLVDAIALIRQVPITGKMPVPHSCTQTRLNQSLSPSLMHEARASCVLVMEGATLVGLLTEGDIVRLAADGRNLEGVKAADVMTRHLITLQKSDCQDILTVLNVFRQHRIRHLPILSDRGQLVGMVTPDSLRQVLQPADLIEVLQQEVRQLQAEKVELLQKSDTALARQVQEG